MHESPKRWVATVLGLFGGFLGLLYAGQPRWALLYGMALMSLAGAALWFGMPETGLQLVSWAFALACAMQARHAAMKFPAEGVRRWYSRWYGLLVVAGLMLAAVGAVRAFLWEPFRVPAGSMQPTVAPGASVLVGKWGYGHYDAYGFFLMHRSPSATLRRGDLLVFDVPQLRGIKYVKRVIGLPGDVLVYEDKQLQINGEALIYEVRPDYVDAAVGKFYARRAERLDGRVHDVMLDRGLPPLLPSVGKDVPSCQLAAPHRLVCKVPQGHVFMMGDNRDNSLDSRYLGPIPLENIVGKVLRIEGRSDLAPRR